MNSKNSLSGLSVVAVALALVIASCVSVPVYGQDAGLDLAPGGQLSLPSDWSSKHVIYSGAFKGNSRTSAGEQASKMKNDPRLLHSWLLQGHLPMATTAPRVNSAPLVSSTSSGMVRAGSLSSSAVTASSMARQTAKKPHRDWSLSLGNGGVAQNMFPAKFNFDIGSPLSGAPGPPPTGNCLNDFVVFGLNVAGSATQANLVGVDDLYSGTSPAGLCGSTPNVKFAYNVSTIGGKITTSPILSLDGTMVAFVESSTTASVLHILRWKDSNGTVTAPVTPTTATSAATCTAPCMVNVPYGSSATTLSSPYYDYPGGDDALYVGNDNGQLFQIIGTFLGTPIVSTMNGWSSTGIAVANTGVKMTGPVLDSNSGNIFIGGSDGKLYAVQFNNPATRHSIAVGSGSANGGGIVDAPTVDGFSNTVFAYAAANAANVGGTSLAANTQAVTLQADTMTPFGTPSVATIGQGTLGAAGNAGLNELSGAFDNGYYNWSGTGANTGYFYMIGTASNATSPTLYQLPFSGVKSISLTGTGSGYTTPVVSISGGGTGATATASGGVDSVTLTTPGSGYTSIPTAVFSAAPTGGTTASGAAVSVGVNSITVTAPGTGYTSAPTVTVSGTGSGSSGTTTLGVASVAINSGGVGYTSVPSVTATGGTTNATMAASVGTSTVNVTAGGSYTTLPTVTFTGGGTGTAQVGVNTIPVATGGSGYTAPPTVTINGSGTGGGTATAALGANLVTITAGGSYTALPTATTFDAPPSGTTATGTPLVGLLSIGVTAGGSGFTSIPGITISGSGAGGGTATASVGVSTINVSAGGANFTSVPSVVFGATGQVTPASATAALGVDAASVTAGGSYTSLPTVAFPGGTTNATGSAQVGVLSIGVSAGGSGFTSIPGITISGSGTGGGTATAAVGVSTISVPAPTVSTGTITVSGRPSSSDTLVIGAQTYTFASGCGSTHFCIDRSNGFSNAQYAGNIAAAIMASSSICSTSGEGSNCFGTGTTANTEATATVSGTIVTVTNITSSAINFSKSSSVLTLSPSGGTIAASGNGSAGCTNGTQALTFSGTGGSGAAGTATISGNVVQSVTLTTGGSGYTTFPSFTVNTCTSQPTTTTVTATVTGVTVTGAGSYTTFPTAATNGGGGSGATLSLTAKVVGVAVATPGTGYTAGPISLTFTPTGASATADLKVVGVGNITPGSYTTYPTLTISGGGGSGATANVATATVTGVTIGNAGSYSTYPTAATSGGGGTGATLAVTAAKVVGVTVTNAGTGYTTGPINVNFTPAGATGTADLKVVSTTVTAPGSYTAIPTATITGNATLGTLTAKVVGVTVTAPGSSTTYPTVTFSGSGGATATVSSVTVVGVAVSTPGTGYTSVPTVAFSTSGSTTSAIATASMGVSSVIVTAPGSYTSYPTASVDAGFGGSGTTLSLKIQVVSVGVPSTPGSGYTTAPLVTFSGGGGTGAAASATINVTAVSVIFGGGGYTTATATITGGVTNPTATVVVNPGTVMSAGTPTANYQYVIDTANLEPASPLSEIYNGVVDRLFYSWGASSISLVYSQDVTNGVISTSPAYINEPSPAPGTSGIVVDNISSQNQASSIYFGTLGQVVSGSGQKQVFIASVTSPGSFFAQNVATVTTTTPHGFSSNNSVVIANVVCTAFLCPNYNGTWTITGVTPTTFTFVVCSGVCGGGTSNANTGTATSLAPTTSYQAVKLTQSALN